MRCFLAGAFALMSGLAAPFGASAEPPAVKVGCLFPLTGPGGLYGRDSAVAVQMALDDLSALAVPDYPQLDVKIADTRSKALRSVQIAQSFIEEDEIDFLCGVVSSSIARAVSAKALKHEVFFIGTDHASPSLVSEDLHPYYFRVSNDTRQSMLAGAKYIAENHKLADRPLRIAFVGPDYEYGYQAWEDLRAFLDQQDVDYEISGEYWPKLFETDYTLYLQQLTASSSDIVVSGHWGLDLVTFVKQAGQFDLFEEAQFMNFDAGANYEIFAELGNDMPLGLVLSARHHVNWPPTERNTDFVNAFHARAGRYPSYAAQGAYAGVWAIAEAVRHAEDPSNKDHIRAALEGLVLPLPEDPKGFMSTMDPASHQLLQVQAIGRTMFNNRYPPATVQLGDWSVYFPPASWPKLNQGASAD
ncbi:ABC transporter substrate-binding protein [Shimia thalassica]|uniref:ABC transporter substrate-binding protein n=1 Tax=Shimia thalassica TaxID=1715693 RepID=UPI0026E12DF5|nr:ABC transporter substrate-binding protein [Shimia thalassica]MDO6799222.1 ABC transporter substrate-binding protein [Shimia thalassica]